MSRPGPEDTALRRATRLVLVLNLGYFGIEFAVAAAIGSVALFADSVDFLEDASVATLILVALGWSARNRAKLGMALAGVLLIPSAATLWIVWIKLNLPATPNPVALTATGAGALAVNATCALLLTRHRRSGGSMLRAAFLSARNDVLADIAIIAGGLVTAAYPSPWPDLTVGLGIAALNATAAHEVWQAARAERGDDPAARV